MAHKGMKVVGYPITAAYTYAFTIGGPDIETFTEAGAETMKKRLAEMKIDTTDIQISTYHSFCNNILRDYTHLGSAKIVKRSSFLVWALDNIDSFKFDHWLDIKNIKSTSNTAELIEKLIDGISTFKDELIKP